VYIIVSVNATGADDRAMPSEDRELIARCKTGDPGAYDELVRRHRKGVYRVAYAILGNHEQAEDIVQEAFVRAYRAIHSFNPKYAFRDWIRRITVNCTLNVLRQQRTVSSRSQKAPGVGSSPDPAQHAAASDLQEQVRKALEALPPRQRTAMTLFALEDMDLASTAAAMGCAVGTVKTHLHRARQKLRQALADYLEEDKPDEV